MKDEMYEQVVSCIIQEQNSLYRLALSYTKDRDSAMDVVQNTVLKALESYGSIRKAATARAWLFSIAVHESIRYLNKNRRELPSNEELPEQIYVEQAYEPDDGETVYESVMKLPDDMRTVVILRYYEELSLKEIAEITNTNLNTVKYRLYAAQKRIEKMIKEEL